MDRFREKWLEPRQTGSVLWLIALGHTFTHWCPATFYLLLPFLVRELDLSYSQAGFLITLRSLVNFAVNFPAGILADVLGHRGLLMASALIFTGIPYLLVGLSYSYFWIALFLAFVGVGNYLWHPAAISILSERYPERRGFAIAVHAVGPNVGEMIAPLLVGVLLLYFSWRPVLFLNVLPGLLIVGVLWKFLFSSPDIRSPSGGGLSVEHYWRGIKAMARNSRLLLLVCVAGMRSMTQSGLHTFLPIYLTHEAGLSSALVGFYLSLAQTAGMISTPLAGGVSDRAGRKPVITSGLVSTSVILVALAYFQVAWLFIAILSLLGFFLYAVRPVIWAWVLDMSPKDMGGTTVSAFSGAQSLFSSVAPVVCGFVADRWGILSAFYFLAATVLVANFIVMAIPEAKKAEAAQAKRAVEAQ